MSLSSLIVQREVATMRQVEEALARQVIYGGDLVTNLLEVARVDEERLLPLLAEDMQIRPAPVGELPPPDARARALLPPEMAAQRSVVPLAVEDDALVVAVAEPLPRDLADQLAFALGMAIEQRAAPAVRVKQAVARLYGVPLERRMQRLVARLAGEAAASGSMPPPLGAAPAVPEPPRPPSAPPAPGRTTARNFLAARPITQPMIAPVSAPAAAPANAFAPAPTLPSVRAPEPPPAQASASAPGAGGDAEPPSTPAVAERRTGLLERKVPASVRAARRRRGPVTFDTGKSEAEEATDRDALLDLYFDFSRQFFDYAVLFIVHGDIAEGRDAFGVGASRERVVGIGVPLDLPGLMATAREQRVPTVTRAPADGLDAELLADLQRPRDVEIALVPLIVRTRAVAILLGDCGEAGIDRATLQQVIAFSGVIGKAFERIIVRRKLDGFIAGSKGALAGRVDPVMVEPKTRRSSIVPVSTSAPPPANVAMARTISGPPIPREEPPGSGEHGRPAESARIQDVVHVPDHVLTPSTPPTRPESPMARSHGTPIPPPIAPGEATPDVLDDPGQDADAHALFDELWEGAGEDVPPPPPSAAIAVPPHKPPLRHTDPPGNALPSVIVDFDQELGAMVDRLAKGEADEQAEGELLREGERAMHVIMTRFPGPVSFARARIATGASAPRASECGPVLRLVARERKVALPFVLQRLTDPDTETRGWATHLLCELPYVEAIAPLLLRLRDVDASTRMSAALALAAIARMFPEEVRDALLALARSADPVDRSAAMRAMAELREPSLVPELVRALADGDEAVVLASHTALVQVTRQDLGLDARPWLRWWELNASRQRIEWLIDALTHDVSEIRRTAGEELRALSKEYFGYASDLPPRDRERAQQRYRDWWITEGRARFRRRP